jgi:ABC-type Na+ efflux pump permease subunit
MRTTNKIKIVHWLPRIICILAILFISLFALDAFQPNHTIWQQIGDFLMHLIPSFILTALLIIAWKWELIGGIIFTVIGLGLSPVLYSNNYNMNHSIWISLGITIAITLPFVLVGVLFIINHFPKKMQTE